MEWNDLSLYTCPESKGCENVYLLYDKPDNRPYGAQISNNQCATNIENIREI